ncbi:MAG: putative molybdenum carrier protein [Bacteroidota bacterium]|nr:putative molybdenum carrier protein [Bacteroidota bacterium]
MFNIKKIISGGQTGADMAALDFGLRNGISIGGWCPKGRINETGTIPQMYPLIECISKQYSVRTEKNVIGSDATLIFTNSANIDNGTKLCIDFCQLHLKEFFVFDIFDFSASQIDSVKNWLQYENIVILNIAGNRESTLPGVYYKTLSFLQKIFEFQKPFFQ